MKYWLNFETQSSKKKTSIRLDNLSKTAIFENVKTCALQKTALNLKSVINAAGVVVHTNLGRSLLPLDVIKNVTAVASQYSNLEFDLCEGRRGLRYTCIESLVCEITGAEAAMVVNNNAGAVLLCLETLARGKQAVVSRGELVEIGGSFRIPDVMVKSGTILKEVGTTNRTHIQDYENAIIPETGLLLKVHTSNYSVVGFTASVSLAQLCELGKKYNLLVMEDLGSGIFIDLSRYGLIYEPTVQDSVKAGADIVTFSGDKLLGGPQAGIIVGKKTIIEQIRKNPLTRALRVDKMTLAALEATLRLYRDPQKALKTIPTLRMITDSFEAIEHKAIKFIHELKELNKISASLIKSFSKVGGGSMPLQKLPTQCVGIQVQGMSAKALEKSLRNHCPPIIARIEDNRLMLDFRTIQDNESPVILAAFRHILEKDA